jgi:hypothetical protein
MTRKSAQARLAEHFNECDATRDVLRNFIKSAEESNSYAYVAGYMESKMMDLIMMLPRAKREEIRNEFDRKARDLARAA